MRSRSSRLFIVLVHVIGVSHHLPRGGSVPPISMVLKTLDLSLLKNGLEGLELEDEGILNDPFWLQDPLDQTCFGPYGFSECGDTTIWYIRQFKSPPLPRRAKCVLFCDSLPTPPPPKFALQYHFHQNECLMLSNKKKKQHEPYLGSCTSPKAWSWNMNEQGMLLYESKHSKKKIPKLLTGRTMSSTTKCLVRPYSQTSQTTFSMKPCQQVGEDMDSKDRRITFSLIRQRNIIHNEGTMSSNQTVTAIETTVTTIDAISTAATLHIANTKDLAHSQASVPTIRTKQIIPTNHHNTHKGSHQNHHHSNNNNKKYNNARAALSPTLFHDALSHGHTTTKSTTIKSSSNINIRAMMQPHPYIAVSTNGIYTDPQTGLAYHTDLCHYLGETKQKSGRHTLTGVGQYTKTMLKIKVYGVALYLSKRDALADPTFRSYASLSVEELRTRPDFYSYLRHMPTSQGTDRTLLLKLNMQLSTETMRSSLQADWKLLTDERKELLINSSMQPRPAEERMLQTIRSPANSGRCSCGQVAPEEYQADPSCCARGTELVFTWRKNGNLEVRLDGRVMDIFPRPDVAEGIFYEYLRYDAPISLDFKEHVVDGFPFLLAPLALVRDFPTPMPQPTPVTSKGVVKTMGHMTDRAISQAGEFAAWAHSHTSVAATNIANVAKAMGDSARGMAEDVERGREHLWTQVSSMPDHMMQRVSQHPDALAASVTNWLRRKRNQNSVLSAYLLETDPNVFRIPASQWFGEDSSGPDKLPVIPLATGHLGQQVFVWMVHLYLLLLLIVSLPGSHTIKLVTRRSYKVPCDTESDASTSSSSDEDLLCASPRRRDPELKGGDSQKRQSRNFLCRRSGGKNDTKNEESSYGKMKKSLSYFL